MLLSLIEVLIVIVPLLLSVAFMTIAERKAMGSFFNLLYDSINH